MALSGSAQTNLFTEFQNDSDGTLGMIFSWSASQSVETNISTITWTLKTYGSQKATGGWYYTSGPLSMSLTASTGTISNLTKTSGNVAGSISGNSWSFSGRQKLYGTGYSIAGGTFKLTHNTTGEASFNVSLSAAIYYSSTNCRGSGSFTLNSIPRATTPAFSLTTIELGQSVTVDLKSRASKAFTHTLTYTFGSLTNQALGTAKTSKETFSFTFPTSLSTQMTNVGSKTCTVTCKTFSGNTQIGTKTVTLTLTAPSSWLPGITTISCTPSNTVLGTDKYPATVTGVTVSITCSTTNLHNATIANVAVTFQGKTYSTTTLSNNVATIATDVCTGSGSQTLVILVTDSRGRSVSDNTSINVIAYTNPILTLEIKRTDGTDTNNTSEIGNYMYISYSGTVSTTGGLSNSINTASGKTPVLKYKKAGDSEYTSISLSPASGSTSYTYISATDTQNYNPEVQNTLTCEVVASITDLTGNTTTVTKTLAVGYKTMDFLAGGRGIAFGTSSTEEGFKCAMPATFTDTLDVSENATVDGTLGVTGKTTMSTSETTGNATFDGAMNHVNGSTSMNVPDSVFDLWQAVFPTHRHGRRKSGSKTETVNITKYRSTNGSNGVWAFMFIGASWAAADATSSLYICHGIQGGAHNECRAVYKDTYGPSISISGTTLTITYYNTDGGAFAIIPLFGKDINIDENTVTPYT